MFLQDAIHSTKTARRVRPSWRTNLVHTSLHGHYKDPHHIDQEKSETQVMAWMGKASIHYNLKTKVDWRDKRGIQTTHWKNTDRLGPASMAEQDFCEGEGGGGGGRRVGHYKHCLLPCYSIKILHSSYEPLVLWCEMSRWYKAAVSMDPCDSVPAQAKPNTSKLWYTTPPRGMRKVSANRCILYQALTKRELNHDMCIIESCDNNKTQNSMDAEPEWIPMVILESNVPGNTWSAHNILKKYNNDIEWYSTATIERSKQQNSLKCACHKSNMYQIFVQQQLASLSCTWWRQDNYNERERR